MEDKVQNHHQTILKPQDLNKQTKRYKFWNSSITGNQKNPTNMKLLQGNVPVPENMIDSKKVMKLSGLKRVDSFDSLASDDNQQNSYQENQNDQKQVNGECLQTDKIQKTIKFNYITKIRALEEEMQDLRKKYQEGRVLNTELVKQLNNTTNSLRAAEILNEELRNQNSKLCTAIKVSHDRFAEIQREKMELLTQISSLNQQKQLAISKSQINQQQVYHFGKKIEMLHEELSFEKTMANDQKKQVLMLKEQLSKMMSIMQDYSQLQDEVSKTHQLNLVIQKRVVALEEQLKQTKNKVQGSEVWEEKYKAQQNRLFIKIGQLETEINLLKEKIKIAEEEISVKTKKMEAFTGNDQLEAHYVKVLQQYEKRNEDLVFEIMALSNRNQKLIDDRNYYLRRVEAAITNKYERLPYDQFISILIQTDHIIQSLKRTISQKQDEIAQLNIQFKQQSANYHNKIEQLTNMLQIRDKEISNKQQLLQNQIKICKKEYDAQLKKNDQLKTIQVGLKLEILQKDRIIIGFIEKRKTEDEDFKTRLDASSGIVLI